MLIFETAKIQKKIINETISLSKKKIYTHHTSLMHYSSNKYIHPFFIVENSLAPKGYY